MGTITGTSIMNRAAMVLFDVNNIKWPRTELLEWVNDAQRALVTLLPEAASAASVMPLVAGTRQTIPSADWLLLEATSNMNSAGTVRGRALRKVNRETFDETTPGWYDAPSASVATVYMYDARDKAAFDIYPPNDGTGYIEVICSQTPVDLPNEGTVIGVQDVYQPALLDYILFRCHSKGGGLGDPAQAEAYFKSFSMYVGTTGSALTSAAGAGD